MDTNTGTYQVFYRRDRWDTGIAANLTAAGAMHAILDGGHVDVVAAWRQGDFNRSIWAGDHVPGLLAQVSADVNGEVTARWTGADLDPAGTEQMLIMTEVLHAAVLLADMCNARSLLENQPLTDAGRELAALRVAQARANERAGHLDGIVFALDGIA